MHLNANGQHGLPYVSTVTFLTQQRAQYRLTERFDWAAEARVLFQPASGSRRTVFGTELGVWAMPDLRFGLGYNFTPRVKQLKQPLPRRGLLLQRFFELSNLFDLFGTSRSGLANADRNQAHQAPPATQRDQTNDWRPLAWTSSTATVAFRRGLLRLLLSVLAVLSSAGVRFRKTSITTFAVTLRPAK
jgi:hypothetical protein